MAKKPEPPVFPIAFLVTTSALIADLAGLTCLFLSELPLLLKIFVGAALIATPLGSVAYFAGKRRQWNQASPYINDLEREVRHLREELRPGRPRTREAA